MIKKIFSIVVLVLLVSAIPAPALTSASSDISSDKPKVTKSTSQNNTISLKHFTPKGIYILPEQLSSDTVAVFMYAVFNKSKSMFTINDITKGENKFVVRANCLELEGEDGEGNISVEMRYIVLTNLTVGNFLLEIVEDNLKTTIASKSFEVRPFGVLINGSDSGLKAELETFIGGSSDDNFYLFSSPTVPVCPPDLFEYTNFWANSTSHLYLVVTLSNEGLEKDDVTLYLTPEIESVIINPEFGALSSLGASSARILYEVNLTGVAHGVYNITYNLSYTENSTNHTITGVIPFGVYELNVGLVGDNVSMHLITPFNDTVDALVANWINVSRGGDLIPLPSLFEYNITYSNFTIQEPYSPWVHIAIAGTVGGIVGSAGEIVHQVREHGWDLHKWDENWNERVAVGFIKGGASGAVGAATLGTGSVALFISGSTATDMWLDVADQAYTNWRETGELAARDVGRLIEVGVTSMLTTSVTAGIKVKSNYKRVKTNLDQGKYSTGKWLVIREAWDDNDAAKQFSAVFKHIALTSKQTAARWTQNVFGRELIEEGSLELGKYIGISTREYLYEGEYGPFVLRGFYGSPALLPAPPHPSPPKTIRIRCSQPKESGVDSWIVHCTCVYEQGDRVLEPCWIGLFINGECVERRYIGAFAPGESYSATFEMELRPTVGTRFSVRFIGPWDD